MGVPLSYSIRNLWTRRLTTLFTVSGMALVVFVFSSMLMLAEGLKKTLVETGTSDNVVVIRKGSATEVQSGVERSQASIIETQPEIAFGADGRPLLAKESVVIISMPRRGTRKENYITVRGIDEASLALRPQVRLIEGRPPRLGTSELMAARGVAERFEGGGLGESLRFGLREWRVVGVFDAGNTSFNSEIWVDAEQLMQTFRRNAYSSVLFKLQDPSRFETVKHRIESDPRLALEAKRENRYYEEQSRMMATFLRILGTSLTVIFSLGAIIGAMITMYAAVANRTPEIGTLRALGFKRRDILTAFLIEALFLGLSGGVVGLFFASFLQFFSVSTMNFQTFSELAFDFTLTFDIAYQAIAFSLLMGLVGGLLPAIRAARMNIVESLRAT